jgi:hypothetical protein
MSPRDSSRHRFISDHYSCLFHIYSCLFHIYPYRITLHIRHYSSHQDHFSSHHHYIFISDHYSCPYHIYSHQITIHTTAIKSPPKKKIVAKEGKVCQSQKNKHTRDKNIHLKENIHLKKTNSFGARALVDSRPAEPGVSSMSVTCQLHVSYMSVTCQLSGTCQLHIRKANQDLQRQTRVTDQPAFVSYMSVTCRLPAAPDARRRPTSHHPLLRHPYEAPPPPHRGPQPQLSPHDVSRCL